jgi:hypothetical protein
MRDGRDRRIHGSATEEARRQTDPPQPDTGGDVDRHEGQRRQREGAMPDRYRGLPQMTIDRDSGHHDQQRQGKTEEPPGVALTFEQRDVRQPHDSVNAADRQGDERESRHDQLAIARGPGAQPAIQPEQ